MERNLKEALKHRRSYYAIDNLSLIHICTNHATDDHGSHHAVCPAQPGTHQNQRSQDQCHQSHSRYRIRPHDSDSISSHRSKQERNNKHNQYGDNGLEEITQYTDCLLYTS